MWFVWCDFWNLKTAQRYSTSFNELMMRQQISPQKLGVGAGLQLSSSFPTCNVSPSFHLRLSSLLKCRSLRLCFLFLPSASVGEGGSKMGHQVVPPTVVQYTYKWQAARCTQDTGQSMRCTSTFCFVTSAAPPCVSPWATYSKISMASMFLMNMCALNT